LFRKRQKALALVETTGALVFGIYDHSEDTKRSLRRARHLLYVRGLAIAAHSVAQAVVDRLRIEQRIDKRLTVANR
jgi:hypothetical protein